MKTKLYSILTAIMLSLVFVVGCKRQNAVGENDEAVLSAKQFFEQSYGALTKAADGILLQKPMPGEFTPLWNNSRSAIGNGASSVDVPIVGQYKYVAVRGQHTSHEGPCDHKTEAVNVVQKLSVVEKGANSRACYIMTIIPDADCDVTEALLENEFSAVKGNGRFSGFVAYNRLDGSLSHVEKYSNGQLTKRTDAKVGDENEIADLADGVVLYSATSPMGRAIEGELGGETMCTICGQIRCPYIDAEGSHCPQCRRLLMSCFCNRCDYCREIISNGKCACPDVEKPLVCSKCNKPFYFCNGHSTDPGDPEPVVKYLHDDIIKDIFSGILNADQIKAVQSGAGGVDNEQDFGYEYLHGIKVWNSALTNQEAKMKNSFVSNVLSYLNSGVYQYLGVGLHAILDTYYPLQDRIDMLKYFSYDNKTQMVYIPMLTPYPYGGRDVCINAFRTMYNNINAIKVTPSSMWEANLGQLYDNWANPKQDLF